jgi:hypothetical protein
MKRATQRFKALLAPLMLACLIPITVGCASQQETEPNQEVISDNSNASAPVNTAAPAAPSKPDSDGPDSVLGATAHAVGTVILFPFRVVGDTLELLL